MELQCFTPLLYLEPLTYKKNLCTICRYVYDHFLTGMKLLTFYKNVTFITAEFFHYYRHVKYYTWKKQLLYIICPSFTQWGSHVQLHSLTHTYNDYMFRVYTPINLVHYLQQRENLHNPHYRDQFHHKQLVPLDQSMLCIPGENQIKIVINSIIIII